MANFRIAAAAALFALAACGGSTTASYAPPTSTLARSTEAARAQAIKAWSHALMRTRLPGPGCYRGVYPGFDWKRVSCSPAPNIAFPPRHPRTPESKNTGNGDDYTLVSLPYVTAGAIGSFDSVTGVKSVRSKGVPSFGGGGLSGLNVYSLQLNSNNFSSSSCLGQINCLGWEQFVYTNQPVAYDGGGNLIIQDWLLATTSQKLKCPAGGHWISSGGSCYKNAQYSIAVPNVPITELPELSLAGTASASGDSAFLAVGSIVYGMQNMQGDGILDLSQHWTGSEFNVVGNGGGTRAVFNSGSTISVRIEADTGQSTKPVCRANSGTTGESNNLSFVTAPADPFPKNYPSIVFTETNTGSGGGPSCDTVAAQ